MKLPDCPFYLFGMGPRRKLLYGAGVLSDALTGAVVRRWDAVSEAIRPAEYRLELQMARGETAEITEDEDGVWVREGGRSACLTEGPLSLPRFERHPHAALLRALHHEILINVVNGRPLPNLFVYGKPWHRDAAMMCMCLERTGNLRVVGDWILGLSDPFDRNNAGHREPDNLGQTLYMISLVADACHPLVGSIVREAKGFRSGGHIVGFTDYAEHPVYQTKWLKFGLRSLGLEDPWTIPRVYDPYSALFWMNYRDAHEEGPAFSEEAKDLYPYLGCAEAHFHGWDLDAPQPPVPYPITYEAQASQADYAGMARVCTEYVERKVCAPHSWHAAEMFLYLLDAAPWQRPEAGPGT